MRDQHLFSWGGGGWGGWRIWDLGGDLIVFRGKTANEGG